jgi:hypothetical protein
MAEVIKSGENPQAPGTWVYRIEGQANAFVLDSSGNITMAGALTANGGQTITGNQTVNGVLAVSSAQGTSGVLQITNTVDNSSDGTIHLEQFDAASRAIGIRVTGESQQRFLLGTDGAMGWGAGSTARDTFLQRTAAGLLSVVTGTSFSVATAGQGLRVAEGANAKQGTATLVAGSATVANTSVTSTSRIFLTSQQDGGTPGWLRVSTRTAGTSFTITSSSNTDTSTVAWEMFEVG